MTIATRLRRVTPLAHGSGALGLYAVASSGAIAVVLGVTSWLSLRHFRALPTITEDEAGDANEGEGDWPHVSIVVPARNEERNLPRLLASLTRLDYPDYEILVVDDGSTDRTAAIARDFTSRSPVALRVLSAPPPAPGWTGKNAACAYGAEAAGGDWLLFTDADTEHRPSSLRLAMRAARVAHASALSLFTEQQCDTFWERLLLPFAYQQYFSGARPARLTAKEGPALANGQYFLIARVAYEASGGHASVRSSLIDDVALANALKRAGYPPLPCRGEALSRVRMYHSLGELVEGFTKNSFQFLREQRSSAGLVVLGTACAAGVIPATVGAALYGGPVALGLCGCAYAIQVVGLAPWARDFGVPARYAALAPVAALVFTGIALSSMLHVLTRRPVRWKGRGYPTTTGARAEEPQRERTHARS